MPIEFDKSWIDDIKANMTELADVKKERFMNEWSMAEQDAELLASERATAEWFEETVKLGVDPKAACNWIKGEFMKLLNEDNIQIDDSKIKPGDLVEMIGLIDKGTISGKIAKTVFEEMYKTGKKAGIIVEEKGLVQMSDESGLEAIIDDILANNGDAVEKFKAARIN